LVAEASVNCFAISYWLYISVYGYKYFFTSGGITLHNIPFLPIQPASAPYISLQAAKTLPHFNLLSDNGIAALFLETVADNPEEAWAFVSRYYAGSLDLYALHEVLGPTGSVVCPCLINMPYEAESKNCRTRSVLVMDAERKEKRLLHLHMVREPDKYGSWKIYGVEQE
jgi:hypothetical protein